MVQLDTITAEETPLFASLLAEGGCEALFEEWAPASTEAFIREHFPEVTEDEVPEEAPEKPTNESESEKTSEFNPFGVSPLHQKTA